MKKIALAGVALILGGVLLLCYCKPDEHVVHANSDSEYEWTNTREVTVAVENEGEGLYLFEGNPDMSGIYELEDLNSYVEGWQSDDIYDQEHIRVRRCSKDVYWVSAEYWQQDTPEKKWRRMLVDLSKDEAETFHGELPEVLINDAVCVGDAMYLVGWEFGGQGSMYKLENGEFTDLSQHLRDTGYVYRLLDIEYDGTDTFYISGYTNNYTIKISDYSVARQVAHGWNYGSSEWNAALQQMWVAPVSGQTMLFEDGGYEQVYGSPFYYMMSGGKQMFLQPGQGFYRHLYADPTTVTLFRGGEYKEIQVPEEIQIQNELSRFYTIGGAYWNGVFWVMRASDNYDDTKIYGIYGDRFYKILDSDIGVELVVGDGSWDMLEGYHSELWRMVPVGNYEKESSFELSDTEGIHTVKAWVLSGDTAVEETHTFKLDQTPPPQPELTIVGQDPYMCSKKLGLTWTQEDDNLAEKLEYEIYLDDVQLGVTQEKAYEVNIASLSAGKHEVYVVVWDEAGNSTQSEVSAFELEPAAVVVDRVNKIEVPSNGEVTIEENKFTLYGTGSPYAKLSVIVDDKKFEALKLDSTGDWDWKLPGTLKNGDYDLRVELICGGLDKVVTIKLTVDGDTSVKTELEEGSYEIIDDGSSLDQENLRKWLPAVLIVLGIAVVIGIGVMMYLKKNPEAKEKLMQLFSRKNKEKDVG